MADLLVTEGLTKRYGGLVANDGVAMQLAAGEIRGLIGPNGAGKTTFVNVVTGIERPDGGEVMLGGAPITGLGAARDRGARAGALVPGRARVRQPHGAREPDGALLRVRPHAGNGRVRWRARASC